MSTRNYGQLEGIEGVISGCRGIVRRPWVTAAVLLAVVFGGAANAGAQFYQDDFDSYAPDSSNVGQGHWLDWSGGVDTTDGGFIRDWVSYSPGNSLEIGEIGRPVDPVWTFSGVTSGLWELRLLSYVPSSSTAGTSTINFMSRFPAPYEWMNNLGLNLAGAGSVTDSYGGVSAPMVKDAWIEIRAEMDLDTQTITTYYNDTLLNSGTWGGVQEIAGVDMWSPAAAAAVYYDDYEFAPVMTIDNTLTRDDGGAWGGGLWKESGAGTAEIPTLGQLGTSGDAAVVNSGALNVASDQGAYSLEVVDGSVTIDAGATLTIYDATTVSRHSRAEPTLRL